MNSEPAAVQETAGTGSQAIRQLPLPGVKPPLAGPRRRPRRRKGESWRSYSVRYNTWFYATWTPEFWEAERARGREQEERRKRYLRKAQAYARIQRELARLRHSQGEDGLWVIEIERELPSGSLARDWFLANSTGALRALAELGLVKGPWELRCPQARQIRR